jgi:hypothetical protein
VSAPDLSALRWIKSSYSANNGDCVEIAAITGAVAARDSKNPGGHALVFGPAAFGSFLHGIRSGAFDRA